MTNPDNVGGLLPCPFCGGEAELVGGEQDEFCHWHVQCTVCGAISGESLAPSTPDRDFASESWNLRELCRAAPAGGESFVTFENGHMKLDVNAFLKSPEGIAQLKSIRAASEHFATSGGDAKPAMRIVLIESDGRKAIRTWDDIGDLPAGEYFLYTRPDSAPAGSGEVEDKAAWLERAAAKWEVGPMSIHSDDAMRLRDIAALLRKLQQGAESFVSCTCHDERQKALCLNKHRCVRAYPLNTAAIARSEGEG